MVNGSFISPLSGFLTVAAVINRRYSRKIAYYNSTRVAPFIISNIWTAMSTPRITIITTAMRAVKAPIAA